MILQNGGNTIAKMEPWSTHVYRIGQEHFNKDAPPDEKQAAAEHRRKIEPWLSAVFQSEQKPTPISNGCEHSSRCCTALRRKCAQGFRSLSQSTQTLAKAGSRSSW